MAAPQQQAMKFISTLSVRALLLKQKMNDPANCMDGCDWVEDAVAMYKKGLTAGDFEHLKELALVSNGDLAVTSELKNLEKVCFLDNIAIPAQGSDSVRAERLLRGLVQNNFLGVWPPDRILSSFKAQVWQSCVSL